MALCHHLLFWLRGCQDMCTLYMQNNSTKSHDLHIICVAVNIAFL